jgi:hypothetical protein
MTEAELHAFILRNNLGVLSSIADNGAPQSALMGDKSACGFVAQRYRTH